MEIKNLVHGYENSFSMRLEDKMNLLNEEFDYKYN